MLEFFLAFRGAKGSQKRSLRRGKGEYRERKKEVGNISEKDVK